MRKLEAAAANLACQAAEVEYSQTAAHNLAAGSDVLGEFIVCRDYDELVVRANARLCEFNQLMSQATHDAATERLTVRERQVL